MSVPSNPTLDEIVLEGLQKAGENSPSVALLTRAKTKWIEEIKNDLFKEIKQPKFLQITSHGMAVRGQSRYSMPTDYSNDLTLVLLDGNVSGIAQAGSSTTITMAAGGGLSLDALIGHEIIVTSGTGKASVSQVIDFDPVTQTATVAPAFASAPGAGSTYLVIDTEREVDGGGLWDADKSKFISIGCPRKFFTLGDDFSGEFIFECPPEKAFGMRLRYYANIMKLDVNSSMMSNLYVRWRNMWIKGITAKHLSDNDDDRAPAKVNEYMSEASVILASEGYGVDVHDLKQTVTDYY